MHWDYLYILNIKKRSPLGENIEKNILCAYVLVNGIKIIIELLNEEAGGGEGCGEND